MDKPQCRLCGARHWSNDPHKFPEDDRPQIEDAGDPVDRFLRSPPPKFDRTAYQREYMRKRRAAAQEAKPR